MALIRICSMAQYGPMDLHASVHRKAIFQPQTDAEVPVLFLHLGPDLVEMWPADPEQLRNLGSKLNDLADRLEKEAAD